MPTITKGLTTPVLRPHIFYIIKFINPLLYTQGVVFRFTCFLFTRIEHPVSQESKPLDVFIERKSMQLRIRRSVEYVSQFEIPNININIFEELKFQKLT